MAIRVFAGLEIEAEHTSGIVYNKGNYHEGKHFCQGFVVEKDNSLHTDKFNEVSEFVLRPIQVVPCVIKHFMKGFQEAVQKDLPGDLENVMNFNNSCGCHLTFSVAIDDTSDSCIEYRRRKYKIKKGRMINLGDIITLEFLKNLSKKVKTNVKSIMVSSQYSAWDLQFNRYYAKRLSKANFKRQRYCEYNIKTNCIEFRSFNLLGVTSWQLFHKIIETTMILIAKELKKELKLDYPFTESLSIIEQDGDILTQGINQEVNISPIEVCQNV